MTEQDQKGRDPGQELTAVQQDYIEALGGLLQEDGGSVRVKDLAAALGTRPPTVVRTLSRLRELGLISQEQRGRIEFTPDGAGLAAQLSHRHADVRTLLCDVLGVPEAGARTEACLIEHGLSGETAERLHEFLLRWQTLPVTTRRRLRGRRQTAVLRHFNLVGRARGPGQRH